MEQPVESVHPTPPVRAASLASLIDALREWLRDLLDLALLEGRHAGAGLGLIVALFAATATLLATGWLALVGVGVTALVQYRLLGWIAALALAALVSFVGAGALLLIALRRSRAPLFCATRRQLGLQSTPSTAMSAAHE